MKPKLCTYVEARNLTGGPGSVKPNLPHLVQEPAPENVDFVAPPMDKMPPYTI